MLLKLLPKIDYPDLFEDNVEDIDINDYDLIKIKDEYENKILAGELTDPFIIKVLYKNYISMFNLIKNNAVYILETYYYRYIMYTEHKNVKNPFEYERLHQTVTYELSEILSYDGWDRSRNVLIQYLIKYQDKAWNNVILYIEESGYMVQNKNIPDQLKVNNIIKEINDGII